MRYFSLSAILLLTLAASHAHAWGDRGHAITALIAWQFMTPVTQQRVTQILATDDSGLVDNSFAAQSTWADEYRDSDRENGKERYRQTFRWHFINLELNRADFDAACFGNKPLSGPATAGPAEECITNKIDQFARELRDTDTDARERLRALQFLLHLVGDVHQPLHASNNDDKGGTQVYVIVGAKNRMTLHRYWDAEIVYRLGRDAESTAANFAQRIGPDEIARWQQGSTRDWTMESWRIARGDIYRRLPEPLPSGDYRLDNTYHNRAREIARVQLQRAGVRIAFMLNSIFDPISKSDQAPR